MTNPDPGTDALGVSIQVTKQSIVRQFAADVLKAITNKPVDRSQIDKINLKEIDEGFEQLIKNAPNDTYKKHVIACWENERLKYIN